MNNKKTIVALLLIAIIGIVGLTIAYFANSTDIENTFITKEYGTTYTESFVSPENWLPGDTTPKTVVATNTGEVDQAVRVLVTDAWTTDNDGTLNGWIHSDGTKSTHTTQSELETDERVAVLNLANTSDWTKVGDYYYYNYKLAPGESTSSFLESVTFNSKTKLDDTCTTSTSNGVKTVTCNSSGDDYDNATYTLTLTIETVQYNKYATAWNLNNTVTIANISKPIPNYCVYEAGDVITYGHEPDGKNDYYVLKNSDSSTDYVVALKSTPIIDVELPSIYDGEYNSHTDHNKVPYYYSENCKSDNDNRCINNYDESYAKVMVDHWSEQYSNDLVSINNYKARLIDENDLNNLGYTFYMNTGNLQINSENNTYDSWMFKYYYIYTNNYSFFLGGFWGMSQIDDSNSKILFVPYPKDGNILRNVYLLGFIRPVINLKKDAIRSECPTH